MFPRDGGVGHVLVANGVAGCRAVEASEVDWLFLAGVSSWLSGEKWMGVRQNTIGTLRSGAIVIGEMRWTVTQLP